MTYFLVGDGLAYQDRNPEVRVDINRPDVDINEQIFALKLITKKMESAHKGQNVDWPSTSNCKYSAMSEILFCFRHLYFKNLLYDIGGLKIHWNSNVCA